MMEEKENLSKWKKIVVETDEDTPTTIAVITDDSIWVGSGYRVRCTPSDN